MWKFCNKVAWTGYLWSIKNCIPSPVNQKHRHTSISTNVATSTPLPSSLPSLLLFFKFIQNFNTFHSRSSFMSFNKLISYWSFSSHLPLGEQEVRAFLLFPDHSSICLPLPKCFSLDKGNCAFCLHMNHHLLPRLYTGSFSAEFQLAHLCLENTAPSHRLHRKAERSLKRRAWNKCKQNKLLHDPSCRTLINPSSSIY